MRNAFICLFTHKICYEAQKLISILYLKGLCTGISQPPPYSNHQKPQPLPIPRTDNSSLIKSLLANKVTTSSGITSPPPPYPATIHQSVPTTSVTASASTTAAPHAPGDNIAHQERAPQRGGLGHQGGQTISAQVKDSVAWNALIFFLSTKKVFFY